MLNHPEAERPRVANLSAVTTFTDLPFAEQQRIMRRMRASLRRLAAHRHRSPAHALIYPALHT